jgi:hypothetical protein
VDILNAMDKTGGKLPNEKDGAAVKKYFEKVYPDMDFERVYTSDMKKMVKWFDQLKKNNVEIKLTEEPIEEVAEPVAEENPVKETASKKTVAKEKEETEKEKPAKKPAAKKK